ncbi:MAG TPA: hypothetical protein VFC51_12225 [Chloroflexota bacterium]|nr:hypothetical protein [Chloroflexota bacterium]
MHGDQRGYISVDVSLVLREQELRPVTAFEDDGVVLNPNPLLLAVVVNVDADEDRGPRLHR